MVKAVSSFTVVESARFTRDLRKIDPPIRKRIVAALMVLATLEDPTTKLKPLQHDKRGLWRLRVGDYRVIMEVQESELVIVALDVGHRSSIYGG